MFKAYKKYRIFILVPLLIIALAGILQIKRLLESGIAESAETSLFQFEVKLCKPESLTEAAVTKADGERQLVSLSNAKKLCKLKASAIPGVITEFNSSQTLQLNQGSQASFLLFDHSQQIFKSGNLFFRSAALESWFNTLDGIQQQ